MTSEHAASTASAIDLDALSAALAAASAGAHPPPIERLRAAAVHVIEQHDPRQVVLFGSASRGEFQEDSDFDFLIVKAANGGRALDFDEVRHPETDDRIHVLSAEPDALAVKRWAAGTGHAAAMAEGATVHVRRGAHRIPTLRDRGLSAADMSRRYDRSEATRLLSHVPADLRSADWAAAGDHWWMTPKELMEALELSLKALAIALGRPHLRSRRLDYLWTTVEGLGESLPGELDDALLRRLSGYSAPVGCEPDDTEEEQKATYGKVRPVAGMLLEHARRRVPALLAEHEASAAVTAGA